MKCQIMKMYRGLISLVLFALPLTVFAGWQVAKPEATAPKDPFFQAGTQNYNAFSKRSNADNNAFTSQSAELGQAAGMYAISVSGSVKENLERIMGRYQWKVVWKAPYDYNFDGRITGSSLPNVVEKLLKPFPLKAVMYMSNRTLAIVPRTRT